MYLPEIIFMDQSLTLLLETDGYNKINAQYVIAWTALNMYIVCQ